MATLGMPSMVHNTLSIEQVKKITRGLLYSLNNKKETLWDKFFSHETVEGGISSLSFRKQIFKDLTAADIVNLQEGITPDPKKIQYARFEVAPVSYGAWISYTDESKKYNFDDVVADAKEDLSLHAFQQAEIRKAQALLATKFTMTGESTMAATIRKAKIIAKKNHVGTLHGNAFGMILTPELESKLYAEYEGKFTQTRTLELQQGYIGKVEGVEFFSSADFPMYGTGSDNGKQYALFIGKAHGKLPAKTLSFGSGNLLVKDAGLGSIPQVDLDGDGLPTAVKPDALNQRGYVSYKVTGFATAIEFDEAILKITFTQATIGQTLAEANRSHFDTEAGIQPSL